MNHIPATLIALLLVSLSLPAASLAAHATPVVCIALPKAQLGQGNNSPVDVSEPVRTMLGQYMAGPSVQLVRLDARIPIQIEAEAVEKSCSYVLQMSLVQTKKAAGGGIFRKLAPFASALPMIGAASGMGGMGSMGGMVAAQAVSSAASQDAQQDYMAAMSGAQQSNVKSGDTLTVEYVLAKTGSPADSRKDIFEAKAKQDGEDVVGPLLEKVATSVLTVALAK
jgi:hypothetical protein